MELTLKLTRDEVQGLMNILGELPTKSGVFPLAVKIKVQADEQLKAAQVESEP
jgi:hypothetical protein